MTNNNVLFILARYPAVSGGIEKVTTYLANQFHVYGKQVYIISFYKEDIKDSIYIPCRTFLFPDGILNPTSLRNINYVQGLVKKYNIKYVIFQDSYAPIEGILYHLKHFCKIIVVEHNQPNALVVDKIAEFKESKITSLNVLVRKIFFPIIYIKNVYEVRMHHRRVFKLADTYVVLASSYVSDVLKMVGCKKNLKIKVINNPITIKPKKIDFSNKRKEVLFVGRLEPQKGVAFMLDIWKKFVYNHTDWILRIIGDGSLKPNILKRIETEHIRNVVLDGEQKDLTSFYEYSSVVCMTSRYEGWGLVLVEGMLFGNVVLAFDSYGAVFDIIDNEHNGYIVPSYDINEYSALLSNIAENVEKRSFMGQNAINKALTFNINSIAKKWLKLLN